MKNPYKELLPYIESDAHRFKGRTSEIEEMYESFDRNEFLVCHADSGEGKSSIIEAGLIPKMKANGYFPVRIIFKSDEQFKKNNIDFDNVVCEIIENEIKKLRSNNSISVNVVYPKRLTNSDDYELTNWEKELVDSYAWLKLRYERVTIDNLLYTPVLIFDQFEEVFTNPLSQEWTDKFFKWLQELSTDLCPQRVINELEKHIGNDDFPEINTQKHFKAIFSLRSEYVGKLDYWGIQRHYIPLLKNNRYLLRPLTIKGAKEVITQQDDYDGLNAVADEIIEVLRKQQKGKNYVLNENSELPCIPALFLSVICSRAFSMSKEERTAFMQRFVAEKHEDKETAINSLIESFYEKAVADCGIPSKDMDVIEDILVNNEGSRQRVSSHTDALKAIDFSAKYKKKLKDARLIRVIPEYNRDDDSVEFVHDALCPVIVKRKELRLASEAKIREEERLKEQTRKMRKYMIYTAAIALTIMGILSFLLWQNHRIIDEKNVRIQTETERDLLKVQEKELLELNDSLASLMNIVQHQKDSISNAYAELVRQNDIIIRQRSIIKFVSIDTVRRELNIPFEKGSASVKEELFNNVEFERICESLKSVNVISVTLECGFPPDGRYETNRRLSNMRTLKIQTLLQSYINKKVECKVIGHTWKDVAAVLLKRGYLEESQVIASASDEIGAMLSAHKLSTYKTVVFPILQEMNYSRLKYMVKIEQSE